MRAPGFFLARFRTLATILAALLAPPTRPAAAAYTCDATADPAAALMSLPYEVLGAVDDVEARLPNVVLPPLSTHPFIPDRLRVKGGEVAPDERSLNPWEKGIRIYECAGPGVTLELTYSDRGGIGPGCSYPMDQAFYDRVFRRMDACARSVLAATPELGISLDDEAALRAFGYGSYAERANANNGGALSYHAAARALDLRGFITAPGAGAARTLDYTSEFAEWYALLGANDLAAAARTRYALFWRPYQQCLGRSARGSREGVYNIDGIYQRNISMRTIRRQQLERFEELAADAQDAVEQCELPANAARCAPARVEQLGVAAAKARTELARREKAFFAKYGELYPADADGSRATEARFPSPEMPDTPEVRAQRAAWVRLFPPVKPGRGASYADHAKHDNHLHTQLGWDGSESWMHGF